jgi:deglycase
MMKVSISVCILLLLSTILPSLGQSSYEGQDNNGIDGGYLCIQCPVCGAIFKVTPQEAANTNPYTPCPYCYSAYAGQFIRISCPSSADNTGVVNRSTNVSAIDSGLQEAENASRQNDENSTFMSNSISRGKILMVVPPKDYQEMEFNEPRAYFERNGFTVKTASKGTSSAIGSSGEEASIDMDVKRINLSDFKAVVFVGGEGIDELKLYQDPDYLTLAKSAVQKDMIVGAICLAPKILANAGLLSGKDATSSDPDYIKSKGANYLDQPVAYSGKIITGNGPYAAGEFAQTIVAALLAKTGPEDTAEEQSASVENGNAALHFEDNITKASSSQGITTTASSAKWRCTICGYVYDPSENGGVPFEQLPSTWKCPTCGASKDKFVKI